MKLILSLLILSTLSAVADDPSLKARLDPTGKSKYAERFRLLADIDGDGVGDMLLSGRPDEFGTMGGPWMVYLNRKGEFVAIGELWAHPSAIAIEPDQAKTFTDPKIRSHARIWVYLKSSGGAGAFGYYRVGEDSVAEIRDVEIYPGDAGTVLGNALYQAAFKQSPIPFKIQRSETSNRGVVEWNAW